MLKRRGRGRLVGALFAFSIVLFAQAMLFGGCTLDRGGTQQQECTTDAECPVADANCQLPVCEGGFCEVEAKPDGPVTQQAVGDCAVVSCESGSTVLLPDPSDKPADGPCATFTCNGAELVSSFLMAGAVCTLEGATGTCDGEGTCVISCEFDDQCPTDPSKPCQSPYCDTAAGTCAFEPLPNGPSINEVAGDCLLHLCEGGAEQTEYLALQEACSVDDGDVCDGAGSCKNSDGRPCTDGTECLNGNCPMVDGMAGGICCDLACEGTCESCKGTHTGASDGVCAPVISGTDPKNECANGACDGTVCKLDNGQPCSTGNACLSGHCPGDDGVCCDASCGALCASCKQSDTGMPDGTCAAVTAGTVKPECNNSATNCNAGTCSGTIGACTPKAAGVTCREAPGACDVEEVCNGTSVNCPADAKQPPTHQCRPAAAGGCDVAEFCDGVNNACPSDAKQPSTFECRAAASGGCDVAELCPGNSNNCPSDAKQPSTHECRAAASGGCDVAEFCPGNGNNCPSDAKQPSTHECRAAVLACDEAEFCTGSGNVCPADAFKADGATPGGAGCGFYLCDGNMASCPTSCAGNPDCTGSICDTMVCCIAAGQSCDGDPNNCCSGMCNIPGNGNCI